MYVLPEPLLSIDTFPPIVAVMYVFPEPDLFIVILVISPDLTVRSPLPEILRFRYPTTLFTYILPEPDLSINMFRTFPIVIVLLPEISRLTSALVSPMRIFPKLPSSVTGEPIGTRTSTLFLLVSHRLVLFPLFITIMPIAEKLLLHSLEEPSRYKILFAIDCVP